MKTELTLPEELTTIGAFNVAGKFWILFCKYYDVYCVVEHWEDGENSGQIKSRMGGLYDSMYKSWIEEISDLKFCQERYQQVMLHRMEQRIKVLKRELAEQGMTEQQIKDLLK